MSEGRRIISERILPHAIARGYKRKGSIFYKENSNEDLGVIDFRLTSLRDGFELIVVMSLRQGVTRRRQFKMDSQRLPIGSYDQGNDWYWVPPVPSPYAREGSDYAWMDITMWGADAVLEREAIGQWFPIVDRLIVPGALSSELLTPSEEFPGKFTRSEVRLALSQLNDGPVGSERERLMLVAERERPDIAAQIAERYGAGVSGSSASFDRLRSEPSVRNPDSNGQDDRQ